MGLFDKLFKRNDAQVQSAPARRDVTYCLDCRFLDVPDCHRGWFWASNMRHCRATGVDRWTGDNAEKCERFEFRDVDRR